MSRYLDAVVYFGYVSRDNSTFHQLIGLVEHVSARGDVVHVRVADDVELLHGAAMDKPDHFPPNVQVSNADKLTENRLLCVPVSAILRRLGEEETPLYVVSSPSLVNRRCKLGSSALGTVVRDLFRTTPQGQSAEVVLDVVPTRGQPFYSKTGCWRQYDGGSNAQFTLSTLSDPIERRDLGALRERYIAYLTQQVALKMGGMSRHLVSVVDVNRGVAFTVSNAYLTPQRQLVLDCLSLKHLGTATFLDLKFDERPSVEKGDVIYGRPTQKSLDHPHESGRATLIWINSSAQPGFDAFVRWVLMTPERRATHDPDDAVLSTQAPGGEDTLFSQLIAGYYDPHREKISGNPALARMMQTACWDFEV